MKPVLVLRHIEFESLGFIQSLLDEKGIPVLSVQIDKGEEIPSTLDHVSGVVVLGGSMSVNDNLPWIEPELELIRKARKMRLPVLGHCLGAQVISKALGGSVDKNKVKEIGWFEVTPSDSAEAKSVFGNLGPFEAFHWHGETFSIPKGASPILSSQWCGNQGFVMDNILAFQCHFEVTEAMLPVWTKAYRDEIVCATPSIQTEEVILRNARTKTDAMHELLRPVYNKWIAQLM